MHLQFPLSLRPSGEPDSETSLAVVSGRHFTPYGLLLPPSFRRRCPDGSVLPESIY